MAPGPGSLLGLVVRMRSSASEAKTEPQERTEDETTLETTSSSNCLEIAEGTEKSVKAGKQARSYMEED